MALSSHQPGISHGEEEITGSATIDTGLRTLKNFTPSLKEASITANEESILTWMPVAQTAGDTVKVIVYVTKGGTASGTAGDSAVTVAWLAVGE
jgi:hypothetical protein